MYKSSDCNSCSDRSCTISDKVNFDCKSYKPVYRPLAKLAEIALAKNPQGLYDCFKLCKVSLPTSLR
jgi:hypothetical protein